MSYVILDCYTDEPSGLGVPPFLGTYPRYLFGAILKEKKEEPYYLTIDDVRLWRYYNSVKRDEERDVKTKINVHNLTKNYRNVGRILGKTKLIVVVAGIHTPGKYLSAVPGNLKEIERLLEPCYAKKVLTGPAASLGTQLEGGKLAEQASLGFYDEINENYLGINDYEKIKDYAISGSRILVQIPYPVIAEIETGKGCIGKCSFCTEPLKHDLEFRKPEDIFNEVFKLREHGVKYFRLGKQSCFYSYQHGNIDDIKKLLSSLSNLKPEVLHIDNVNPSKVVGRAGETITKLITKYCTPGNVAAFGVESFDKVVIKKNRLNTVPELVLDAVRVINKHGAKRGNNGMPLFLPGINILFGLIGETKKTFEENYYWLKQILDSGLLLRRINIRQVVAFPGTKLFREAGNKYLKKNKKYYWKWRNKIRQEIDLPMLKMLVPEGTILKNVRMEVYDGKHTFGRQFGTYPLIIGVNERLKLNKFYTVRVKAHMLRSVVGEVTSL